MDTCSTEKAISIFGEKWKFLIIKNLIDGPKRFSELKRDINNISQKMLTQNLRNLESTGVLIRTVYPTVPPKVEYELTTIGYSLKPILDAIHAWGEKYAETR